MTTSELIEAFIESRRAARMSPHTVNWYRWMLQPYAAAVGPKATAAAIAEYIRRAPSGETARTQLRAIRACHAWGKRTLGLKDPARRVPLPPSRRQLPRVFTEGELRRALEVAQGDPINRAAIALLLDTGLRIGELATLRTERIEIDALTVTGKTGDRRVPVTAAARAALMAIAPPAGPVFTVDGHQMAVGTLNLRVRRVLERAGVTGVKRGPHTFRHTFATLYLRAGGDIYRLQRILGHANIRQTMVYLHLSDSEAFSEHARLSPLALITRPRQWSLDQEEKAQ